MKQNFTAAFIIALHTELARLWRRNRELAQLVAETKSWLEEWEAGRC